MKSFDEWFNSHEDRIEWDDAPPIAVDAFEAGQQSKQAEVDDLQKRIDEAIKFANDAHGDLNIGMLKMAEILKGDQL